MSMLLKALREAIEAYTGETIAELQATPIDDRRRSVENASGEPMRLVRCYPHVGRGNVMGDRVLTGGEVDALLDEALR
ncbi:MAG: hypothetical protein H6700_04510 [Myxococcales bacterium]|nr:hypothetical protein [Myxococcales bacterium]MCB9531007.1 hypothetical protein [Myxococcales bacterium]